MARTRTRTYQIQERKLGRERELKREKVMGREQTAQAKDNASEREREMHGGGTGSHGLGLNRRTIASFHKKK